MHAHDPLRLPDDLPVPVDDGACDHLPGMAMPSIRLPLTSGGTVDLSTLSGRTVVYCYPRTGRPDQALPPGWDAIPGARGCTPQSCAYRDLNAEFARQGVGLYGLSTQSTAYQREAVERLHLLFPLISDADLRLTETLRLPTFVVTGWTLLKRLTLIISEGQIEHVVYPVFPPNADAERVLAWITEHDAGAS